MTQRYLTKSRFKVACECPTKLFFVNKPEFPSNKTDDAFMAALAEGGYQVGALAKLEYEDGIEVTAVKTDEAIAATQDLLTREKVVLFEPAIQWSNLLIRADILVKKGKGIEIVEVKSKSFDPDLEEGFYTKTSLKKGQPEISTKWRPYLLDIAFQTMVMRKAHPQFEVSSFLLLADKSAKASVEGLNQSFLLKKDPKGRCSVEVKPGLRRSDLGAPVLKRVCVDEEVNLLLNESYDGKDFESYVNDLAHSYVKDEMIAPPIGSQCKKCEYRINEDKKQSGAASGFELCWTTATGLKPKELSQPMVFDIWNFRRAQSFIDKERYFMDDVEKGEIEEESDSLEPGLTAKQRQWLQVEKVQRQDNTPWIDKDGLASEMQKWRFPLHFIDFETTSVALPFHKGMRPYEQIAFQFSHHVVKGNGNVDHVDEYINTKTGEFPNFEFLRRLKQSLSGDEGSIFRYAAHENTVLCHIYDQLAISHEKDKGELMQWIKTVTQSQKHSRGEWEGGRNMVDMLEMVKRYYYHPQTKGSNSIKAVLPAILDSSTYLQEQYSRPIYGTSNGIRSHNFKNQIWVKQDASGATIDPYKLLPALFEEYDNDQIDWLFANPEESIAEGGAAMMAYARMQFTQMSEQERAAIRSALLKYCELDTLAMVMIYEYWRNEVQAH